MKAITGESLKQADPDIMSQGLAHSIFQETTPAPTKPSSTLPTLGWFSEQPRTPIKRDEVSWTQGVYEPLGLPNTRLGSRPQARRLSSGQLGKPFAHLACC